MSFCKVLVYDYNGQGTIKLPCPYNTIKSLLIYYMCSDFEVVCHQKLHPSVLALFITSSTTLNTVLSSNLA